MGIVQHLPNTYLYTYSEFNKRKKDEPHDSSSSFGRDYWTIKMMIKGNQR